MSTDKKYDLQNLAKDLVSMLKQAVSNDTKALDEIEPQLAAFAEEIQNYKKKIDEYNSNIDIVKSLLKKSQQLEQNYKENFSEVIEILEEYKSKYEKLKEIEKQKLELDKEISAIQTPDLDGLIKIDNDFKVKAGSFRAAAEAANAAFSLSEINSLYAIITSIYDKVAKKEAAISLLSKPLSRKNLEEALTNVEESSFEKEKEAADQIKKLHTSNYDLTRDGVIKLLQDCKFGRTNFAGINNYVKASTEEQKETVKDIVHQLHKEGLVTIERSVVALLSHKKVEAPVSHEDEPVNGQYDFILKVVNLIESRENKSIGYRIESLFPKQEEREMFSLVTNKFTNIFTRQFRKGVSLAADYKTALAELKKKEEA